MSEETKQEKTVQVLKTLDNGVKICLGQFEDGTLKGLKYAYPVVPSGTVADEHYGAEEVANLINAAAKIRIANKVKTNKTPANVSADGFASEMERLAKTEVDGIVGLIFTVEEAENYKPGERTPGIKSQIEEKLEAALEKVKSGNLAPEEAMALFQEIAALKSRLPKKTA